MTRSQSLGEKDEANLPSPRERKVCRRKEEPFWKARRELQDARCKLGSVRPGGFLPPEDFQHRKVKFRVIPRPAVVLSVESKLRLSGVFHAWRLRWARGKEFSQGGIRPGLGMERLDKDCAPGKR